MEFEAVASVKPNYSSSAAANVTPPKPAVKMEAVADATTVTKSVVTQTVTKTPEGRDLAGQQGGDQQKEHAASEATIDDAVSRANHKMAHTRCEYSYHKETNRVSIRVIDSDTDEVVREIPPEKSLDMLQKMWEMAGILVDEKR